MRSLLILVLLGAVAHAQPGQTEPLGYVYAPQPLQLQLSGEQHALLERGEISIGRYVTGGILSYAVGFGVGHAVQGRWADQGWIFTVGESAAFVTMMYGLVQLSTAHRGYGDESYDSYERERRDRRGENYLIGGFLALAGLRVWEVVDAWVAPPIHNRKVRALKQQLGLSPPVYGLYLAPPQASNASGGVAGLSVRF